LKRPTSCYGLEPGNDLKHSKKTTHYFLVCGIGLVNRVAVLSHDKTAAHVEGKVNDSTNMGQLLTTKPNPNCQRSDPTPVTGN